MGDSSVSCVLTGLTMRCQDAVLIPLAPDRYIRNRDAPDYPWGTRASEDVLAPLTLPIFGRLSDTGDFESVERDDHTLFLEARLGVTIEAFCEEVFLGGRVPFVTELARRAHAHRRKISKDKITPWRGRLYGCYVLREAWDAFSKVSWDEEGRVRNHAFGHWIKRAGEKRRKEIRHIKEMRELAEKYPQSSFRLVSDNTPPAERDRQGAEIRSNQSRLMDEIVSDLKAEQALGSVVEKAEVRAKYEAGEPLPTPGGVRQTFSDGRFLVTLHAPRPAADVDNYVVYELGEIEKAEVEEETRNDPPPSNVYQLRFPPDAEKELRALGWKRPRDGKSIYDGLEEPVIRAFPEEMSRLYGGKLYAPENVERLERLLTFMCNADAANRPLQPTPCSEQYGNHFVQAAVGRMTYETATARLDTAARRRAERSR